MLFVVFVVLCCHLPANESEVPRHLCALSSPRAVAGICRSRKPESTSRWVSHHSQRGFVLHVVERHACFPPLLVDHRCDACTASQVICRSECNTFVTLCLRTPAVCNHQHKPCNGVQVIVHCTPTIGRLIQRRRPVIGLMLWQRKKTCCRLCKRLASTFNITQHVQHHTMRVNTHNEQMPTRYN